MNSRQGIYNVFVCQNSADFDNDEAIEFLNYISEIQADEIYKIIKQYKSNLTPVYASNIPQFSEKSDMYKAVDVVFRSRLSINNFYDLGYYLCPVDHKNEAKRKYAENHYKLAIQMGFAYDKKPLQTTVLGNAFNSFEEDMKDKIMKRFCMKVPAVQQMLLTAETSHVDVRAFFSRYLAPTTVTRRRSNMHMFLDWIRSIATEEMSNLLNNISW